VDKDITFVLFRRFAFLKAAKLRGNASTDCHDFLQVGPLKVHQVFYGFAL
jgi:hypothetical protein